MVLSSCTQKQSTVSEVLSSRMVPYGQSISVVGVDLGFGCLTIPRHMNQCLKVISRNLCSSVRNSLECMF